MNKKERAQLSWDYDHQTRQVKLGGALTLSQIELAKRYLHRLLKQQDDTLYMDLSGLTELDTVGALWLHQLTDNPESKERVQPTGLPDRYHKLVQLISETEIGKPPPRIKYNALELLFTRLGKASMKVWLGTLEFISFTGQSTLALAEVIRHPRRLRLSSVTYHIEHAGVDAIPIISLIAFLISIVLAYQGIAQMRPFGGEQFTVNLVAVSVLREMGVLLTAIMVAGRSGSAFTAEIGVMKVREEVDALQVIGMSPFQVLVVPRILALLIAMPLLTFIADMMGLLGGAVITGVLIDISFWQYLDRVQGAVQGADLLVGMVKAPIFALLIAMVGCMHGMKVSGSAESVGRETTIAVVKSIFLVLLADALFSIFFEEIGI